ncbi:hypothetical protein PBRA_008718 [Plasmodiophora brassicae]|nr:hypothetical protein PBRA_008718 [Plasmodiophora brassicae]
MLVRRWNELRERCTSEIVSGRADRHMLRGLQVKLDALDREIASYQRQEGPVDPYWVEMRTNKVLCDLREAVENARFLLESVPAAADAAEPGSASDLVDDDSPFILFESPNDDEVKATTPTAADPGQRYKCVRTVRSTLQGKLVFGIDRSTGDHVALKLSAKSAVLRQESLKGDKVLEDPINEMHLLEQLGDPGHPHVVRLIESLEDDEHYWMVLEFASRGELFDVISESGRLDENTAAKYFLQLAKALEYIHSHNVCHLDLSLENILLDDHGDLKLTDFGLARSFDAVRPFPPCPVTKPGKIGYMSPEIFAGQAFYGPQADIYSAGVILFVMLFGCPPYELPTLADRRFRLLYCGEIRELLRKWQMSSSPLALDLLSGLLCAAEDRLTLRDVLQHPWLSQDSITPCITPVP